STQSMPTATDLSASNSGEQLIVYESNARCQNASQHQSLKAEASMKGSSEKKKRNPLTKLAVDSIDADCNGPVSFELRRAANSLRE
uniref:Ovule protein n=1 Tax=Macrostomum lignano TaxID=282301 RepID=A0A1I8JGB6_9PLAT